MNDDASVTIEMPAGELIPAIQAVQVLVNDTIDEKDSMYAISERENTDSFVPEQVKTGGSQEIKGEEVVSYCTEIGSGEIITLSQDLSVPETSGVLAVTSADPVILNSTVVADGGCITEDNVITNDKQFLVLTPGDSGEMSTVGVGNLELLPDIENDGEPAMKRYRMQGEDGQSYILTVAAEGSVDASSLINEHQYQVKQPNDTDNSDKTMRVIEVMGNIGNVKRSQLVSSDVSQSWFTTRDDKNILQNSGATWKQGQWTKDEVDTLQENIAQYCTEHGISDPTEVIFEMSKDDRKQFYRTVARGLQRPLFSVYRRVTRMYDQKNHMGKYSNEEIQKLRELRLKHGSDWAAIGQALGRSGSSVKDKCRLMRDTCNSGKWLPEEEKRLTMAVYELAGASPGEDIVHGLSWAQVAERVGTRSEKQCRTKWLNYMNWKMKGGKEWTRADDMNLIVRVANLGVEDDTEINWDELARDWKSARSPQWLRGKWWSLKRHIPDYQLLSFSELLTNMKTFYLQNVRLRNALGTARTRKMETSGDQSLAYTLQALNGEGLSGTDDSTLDEMDPAVQAYEVLQQLPNNTGSYIIAHTSNSSQPLNTTLSEHIVVQTIGQSSDTELGGQPRVLIQVPSSELGEAGVASLEHADIGAAIQLAGSIDHTQQDLEVLSGSTDDTSFTTHPLEESVIANVGDVSIVLKQEAFVQSTGNSGQLMTSFSDPMLNSDSNSLMGAVSDVETEKSHADDIIVNMD